MSTFGETENHNCVGSLPAPPMCTETYTSVFLLYQFHHSCHYKHKNHQISTIIGIMNQSNLAKKCTINLAWQQVCQYHSPFLLGTVATSINHVYCWQCAFCSCTTEWRYNLLVNDMHSTAALISVQTNADAKRAGVYRLREFYFCIGGSGPCLKCVCACKNNNCATVVTFWPIRLLLSWP